MFFFKSLIISREKVSIWTSTYRRLLLITIFNFIEFYWKGQVVDGAFEKKDGVFASTIVIEGLFAAAGMAPCPVAWAVLQSMNLDNTLWSCISIVGVKVPGKNSLMWKKAPLRGPIMRSTPSVSLALSIISHKASSKSRLPCSSRGISVESSNAALALSLPMWVLLTPQIALGWQNFLVRQYTVDF